MTGRDMICQLLKTKYKYSNIPHTLDHVLEIIAENMNVLDVWKEEQHMIELRDEIKQLERKLKVIKSSPKRSWISVKDRLPDNANGVIVCDEFGFVYPACYYTFDKCWMYSFTDERCGHKITHWTPLPEPPKEDDAE